MSKKRASRRAQPKSSTDTVTSAELAEYAGVTTKTIRRWYSRGYRLIPPPQIVRNAQSRGTRAVWPRWVMEQGRRITEMQAQGLSVDAIRGLLQSEQAAAAKTSIEESFHSVLQRARELATTVVASDTMREIVRSHLFVMLTLVTAVDEPKAKEIAERYSTDVGFLARMFLFVLNGFDTVCRIDPIDLSLAISTNINTAWALSAEATVSRVLAAVKAEYEGFAVPHAEMVIAFNVSSLVLDLSASEHLAAADLEDASLHRTAVLRPAPLVWVHLPNDWIAEYPLVGDWRDVGFVATSIKSISPAEASLFQRPEFPRANAATAYREARDGTHMEVVTASPEPEPKRHG